MDVWFGPKATSVGGFLYTGPTETYGYVKHIVELYYLQQVTQHSLEDFGGSHFKDV
jgi:hypothetical protein